MYNSLIYSILLLFKLIFSIKLLNFSKYKDKLFYAFTKYLNFIKHFYFLQSFVPDYYFYKEYIFPCLFFNKPDSQNTFQYTFYLNYKNNGNIVFVI